jgi:hypothetical protein
VLDTVAADVTVAGFVKELEAVAIMEPVKEAEKVAPLVPLVLREVVGEVDIVPEIVLVMLAVCETLARTEDEAEPVFVLVSDNVDVLVVVGELVAIEDIEEVTVLEFVFVTVDVNVADIVEVFVVVGELVAIEDIEEVTVLVPVVLGEADVEDDEEADPENDGVLLFEGEPVIDIVALGSEEKLGDCEGEGDVVPVTENVGVNVADDDGRILIVYVRVTFVCDETREE